MLYAVGECLYRHFGCELYLFPLFVLLDEIIDISSQAGRDFEMGLTVLPILVEGEDIVDIVDERRDVDGANGDWRDRGEVFLVFFDEEVTVVEEEAVELR
jgi:hypothetical protein